MPELPEVETTRLSVEKAFKGKRLAQVIPDPDDRIVFDTAPPERFPEALEGARVTGTGRKGKYFWIELNRRPWPVIHLGMTGDIVIRREGKPFVAAWGGELWNQPKRGGEERFLPYCRFRLIAQDGTELAYTDPRRFGRIRLAQDPLSEPPISALGYDPLLDFPSARKLHEILARRRAPIKAVLLDQGLFAGVGNWIADEVLFQSLLSPHRLASSLTAPEVTRLRSRLFSIIRRAVAERADYDRYPRSWLFHYRWGKEKEAVTHARDRIVHDTIGGRTTAWVPKRQK
jgi:formamidopyrimidine-DNA glycosylase